MSYARHQQNLCAAWCALLCAVCSFAAATSSGHQGHMGVLQQQQTQQCAQDTALHNMSDTSEQQQQQLNVQQQQPAPDNERWAWKPKPCLLSKQCCFCNPCYRTAAKLFCHQQMLHMVNICTMTDAVFPGCRDFLQLGDCSCRTLPSSHAQGHMVRTSSVQQRVTTAAVYDVALLGKQTAAAAADCCWRVLMLHVTAVAAGSITTSSKSNQMQMNCI